MNDTPSRPEEPRSERNRHSAIGTYSQAAAAVAAILALILSVVTYHAQQDIAVKQQRLSMQQQIPKVAAYLAESWDGKWQDSVVIENHEVAALLDVRFVFLDESGRPAYDVTQDMMFPCETATYYLKKDDDAIVQYLAYVVTFRYRGEYWKQAGFDEVKAANEPASTEGATELTFPQESHDSTENCG
ncbi:hypothetical protein [Streptomyces sp. NPDC005890]|uniref:hypothetical protein n=1 Tax=Streptomyces sp. NPDC005890 TaxID=3154568 RepID=UPI0033F68FEB